MPAETNNPPPENLDTREYQPHLDDTLVNDEILVDREVTEPQVAVGGLRQAEQRRNTWLSRHAEQKDIKNAAAARKAEVAKQLLDHVSGGAGKGRFARIKNMEAASAVKQKYRAGEISGEERNALVAKAKVSKTRNSYAQWKANRKVRKVRDRVATATSRPLHDEPQPGRRVRTGEEPTEVFYQRDPADRPSGLFDYADYEGDDPTTSADIVLRAPNRRTPLDNEPDNALPAADSGTAHGSTSNTDSANTGHRVDDDVRRNAITVDAQEAEDPLDDDPERYFDEANLTALAREITKRIRDAAHAEKDARGVDKLPNAEFNELVQMEKEDAIRDYLGEKADSNMIAQVSKALYRLARERDKSPGTEGAATEHSTKTENNPRSGEFTTESARRLWHEIDAETLRLVDKAWLDAWKNNEPLEDVWKRTRQQLKERAFKNLSTKDYILAVRVFRDMDKAALVDRQADDRE